MPQLKLKTDEQRWLLKAIRNQLKADTAFLRTYEARDLERKAASVSVTTMAYRREVDLGEAIHARLKDLIDNPKPTKRKKRSNL